MVQEVRKIKRVSNLVAKSAHPMIFWLSIPFICVSYIINAFLLIYQLGTCCVYVVFISSNIKRIVDLYTDEKVDVRLIMVIILLPLIFLNWVNECIDWLGIEKTLFFLHSRYADSKPEILGTVQHICELYYTYFFRNHSLLHFRDSILDWWQKGFRRHQKLSAIFRYRFVRTGSDWSCKWIQFYLIESKYVGFLMS